jgi:hypothetical protein
VIGSSTILLGILAPELLDDAKSWIREVSREDPADAVIWAVLIGAQLFFEAEHGQNPKINTMSDALAYVSTNLSVGYCDIFAVTPRGKQIATVIMTFGPALAARALDDTAAEKRVADAAEQDKHDALLSRLDRIAELLEAPRAQ